ncbi:MAG TPA: tetratricopeptide repeat protein [Kofleriaceae bacterium]|nr:tetratricopeptide repeat protein [Kofleriaceae bacterium]
MKEVACAVCGAVYRFAPADIPPAGKTLTCAKCKARVVVPGSGTPAMAGGKGDVIDLADLPAPRRVPAPAAPALSGRAETIDLPMPSVSTADLGLDLPPPKRSGGGDPLTLDSIDLLAPVGPARSMPSSPSVGDPIDLPMGGGVSDLPTPKRPSDGIADLPAPKRPADGISDLPAPKRSPEVSDLPAPKRPAAPPVPSMPSVPPRPIARPPVTPPPRSGAPATPPALFDDLPAPRGPSIGDLPAPKRPSDAVADLPAPKRPSDAISDLPAPKRPADPPTQDIAPKRAADPPTQDIAPKGFFADLPQPKGPTPSTPPTQDIAPKGYFADLPQAKGPTTSSQEMAPKGFFDDLPVPKHASSASIELATPAAPAAPALPKGGARAPTLDLDGLDLAPPIGSAGGGLELEPNVASARQFDTGASAGVSVPRTTTTVPPPLELGGDADALPGLDLPSSTSGPGAAATRGGVVSFKPSGGSGMDLSRGGGGGGDLDLAGPVGTARPGATRATTATTADAGAKATKKKATARGEERPGMSKKLQRILAVVALIVVVGGAGGYFMFKRYQAQQQRQADIRSALDTSRNAMADGNKNNWQRALGAARQVLALDGKNAEALGLAAQSLLAAYLDDGTQRDARVAEARKHIQTVPSGAGRQPAVERAIALDLIVDGNADAAVTRLKPLADRKDADAILFLGWAHLAAGQWDEAIAAFQASLAASPKRAVPAKYGLARAQLGKGDRAAARASFLEVIALDKDHVGALVGETEAMPANEFVQQETALLAILQRKGIEAADPRVVARAWTLAGDDALRAGRTDQARGYYRKALTLLPGAVDTLVSSAALELRDDKDDDAAAAIEKALSLAPTDVNANLVAAELDIKRGAMNDAGQRLAALETRIPPLVGPPLGRLYLLQGKRFDKDEKPDEALAAYENAGKVLGEEDVEPAIATAMLLGRMAKTARDAKDEAKAVALETRAAERLGRLAASAEQDPALAVTLGVAYLAAGSAKESEVWLRKALAKRPADVEATYQLAEALRRQNKQDEALATVQKAYDLDPKRIDLGVELARGFEAAGRDADAASMYKKLVETPNVSLDVRIRAGRFFARTRDMDSTRKQAEEILAAEPNNAAGLFLRAEGLMADGHFDEARRLYQQAVDTEGEAQYQDGLGRANEGEAAKTGDTTRRDEALRAYIQASEKDPRMLNPRLGRGRLHLARLEHAKAVEACQEALALAPNEPSIPYCIGMGYAGVNDKPKAVEWLTRAVRAKPLADAYYELGKIYVDFGGHESQAAAALTRATELGVKQERDTGVNVPWLTQAYYTLGDVSGTLSRRREQCKAYKAFLERNPTDPAQAPQVTQARTETYSCP